MEQAQTREDFKQIVIKVDKKYSSTHTELVNIIKRCLLRAYGIDFEDVNAIAKNHCDAGTFFEPAHLPHLRIPQQRALNELYEKIINNHPTELKTFNSF